MKRPSSYSLACVLYCLAVLSPARSQHTPRGARKVETQQPAFELLDSTLVGGTGGWDYLSIDTTRRHLFLSHSDRVEVFDLTTRKVIAAISHTEGVHGVAVAYPTGRGFISNGRSNSVLMFDLTTFDTLRRVGVGQRPDAIVYDGASNRVFVMNGGSNNITVLNAETGELIDTIGLGTVPESAVTDGSGHLFLNLEEASEIAKIDTRTDRILARWKLGSGTGPTGLAIDDVHHRLFSVTANKKMVILNAVSGKLLQTLPIGGGADAAAFDPALGIGFSSNGEGSVTVVREINSSHFAVLQTVPTRRGARTCVLDPLTHDLYLTSAQYGATPPPTTEHPRPRPSVLPETFTLLRIGHSRSTHHSARAVHTGHT